MYPQDQQSPQIPQSPDNDIFMSQPTPPPTPEEKKRTALWITIGLIIGFAILIAGVFFAFFLVANSAADRYRAETELHLNALVADVEEIDIDAILNRRDTTELVEQMRAYRNDQPLLSAVLLGESTSVSYQGAMELQKQVDEYYAKVVMFVDSLPDLLEFSRAIDRANNDLEVLLEGNPPELPPTARTVAGSIDNIAQRLEDTEAPEALIALRDDLVTEYRRLAEAYRDLASAFEGPEISVSQAERRIDAANRAIAPLNATDLTEEVEEYRANLVREAQTLATQL